MQGKVDYVRKFRKSTAIAITAGAFLGAAGVSLAAVPVLGGAVAGTISSNGAQPEADWASTPAPTFNGCTLQSTSDSGATGSASISGSGSSATLNLSLGNVYAGEVCSFTATVDNPSGSNVYVYSDGIVGTVNGSTFAGRVTDPSPNLLPALIQPGSTRAFTFTLTVPAGAGSLNLTANLQSSVNG